MHDDEVALTRLVRNAVEDATKGSRVPISEPPRQPSQMGTNFRPVRKGSESRYIEVLSLLRPVAGDLRLLVATLGMLADLDRVRAVAVHIAKIARMRAPEYAVAEPARGTIAQMAEIAMMDRLAAAIASRDPDAGRQLDDLEGSIMQVHLRHHQGRRMGPRGVEAAIDLAVLGRYHERIANPRGQSGPVGGLHRHGEGGARRHLDTSA